MMRFEKSFEGEEVRTLEDWAWSMPTYSFSLEKPKLEVKSIEIDESDLLADINRENNTFGEVPEE